MRDTVRNPLISKGPNRPTPAQNGTIAPKLLVLRARRVFVVTLLYAALLSACINLLQLTMPLYMMQVHDRVLNSQSMDTLVMLTILALGALIVLGVLDYIRALTFQAMGSAVVRWLNLPVLTAAVQASADQGLARATVAARPHRAARLPHLFGGGAPLDAAWSPIFLGVLFLLHPLFGLIGAISVVVLVCCGLLNDLLTRQLMKEASQANIEAVSKIGATLRHAEAIEAMGMLPALAQKWRAAQLHALSVLEASGIRSRAMASITRSLRFAIQVVSLGTGALLVMRQEISPGAMMATTILVGRLLLPFDSVIENWRQWVLAIASWRRVETALKEDLAVRQTMPTPRSEGDLVVDKLVYAAPGIDVPIIKGINFSLSPGEVLGIVGPSAAGKSTLARLLVGILKPTAGGVFLDGNNVYLWERTSFGQIAGYLPQSVSLLEGTIRENIARMAESDPYKVLEAARLADVHDMIGRLPLG